jgi:hypothetical protein
MKMKESNSRGEIITYIINLREILSSAPELENILKNEINNALTK